MMNSRAFGFLTTTFLASALAALAQPGQALTFNWTIVNNVPTNPPGTVSGTISGLNEGLNTNTNTDIKMTVTSSPFPQLPPGPFDGTAVSGAVSFLVTNGILTEYTFNYLAGDFILIGSNQNENFANYFDLGPDGGFVLYGGTLNIFSAPDPAPVPGPLPVLGASAAFAWSRRLRRRSLLVSASRSGVDHG